MSVNWNKQGWISMEFEMKTGMTLIHLKVEFSHAHGYKSASVIFFNSLMKPSVQHQYFPPSQLILKYNAIWRMFSLLF